MEGDGINPLSLVSLFIAILALGISVWSAHQTRVHNRLSVTPRLRISHRFRGASDGYGVRVVNSGLGPAVLTGISLLLDDKQVTYTHQGWIDALEAAGLMPDEWTMTRLLKGTTLQAGEQVWIFRTDRAPRDPNGVIRRLGRLTIAITYESLYGPPQRELRERLGAEDLIIEKPPS